MTSGSTRGDLRTLSLAEVCQVINLGGKTARVSLRTRGDAGKIWFDAGTVVHAECGGDLSGEPAFYRMLAWRHGTLLIEYDLTTDRRSLEGDVMFHVLEGLRRVDESSETEEDPGTAEAAPPHRRFFTPVLVMVPVVTVLAMLVGGWSAGPTRGRELPPPAPPSVAAPETPSAPGGVARGEPGPPRPTRVTPRPARGTKPRSRPARRAPEPASAMADVAGEATLLQAADFTAAPLETLAAALPPPVAAQDVGARVTFSVSLRSKLESGTLFVLVDGKTVHSAPLRRTGGAMRRLLQAPEASSADETRIDLDPGRHVISARILLEDGSEVHSADVAVDTEVGGSREVAILAGIRRKQPIALEVR